MTGVVGTQQFTMLMNDNINPLFGYKICIKMMKTVIRRNIDKVSGLPEIVLIGNSLQVYLIFVNIYR